MDSSIRALQRDRIRAHLRLHTLLYPPNDTEIDTEHGEIAKTSREAIQLMFDDAPLSPCESNGRSVCVGDIMFYSPRSSASVVAALTMERCATGLLPGPSCDRRDCRTAGDAASGTQRTQFIVLKPSKRAEFFDLIPESALKLCPSVLSDNPSHVPSAAHFDQIRRRRLSSF